MLALTMLLAQAVPVPMIPPAQALFALYGVGGICSNSPDNRSPAGQPAQKCDSCCWGHCSSSAAALPATSPLLHPPGAWNRRTSVSPTARLGDRRILDAAFPRGPPSARASVMPIRAPSIHTPWMGGALFFTHGLYAPL